MEGYTDCLMAHQHGLANCVAVLGTALGERHLQLLRRYTDSITLVLDGDEAGRRRTNEILDNLLALFEKKEVNLQILTLPEGVDPCDFIATHGSDSFRALVAQAIDPLEHKFRAVTNGLDTLTDTHRASQAAEQMLATLAQIRPAGGGASSQALLREEQMLSRIARKFHLPEEKLRSRLGALRRESRRRQAASRAAVAEPQRVDDLPACDKLLLELLIAHSGYLSRIRTAIEPTVIQTDIVRQIYETWLRLAKDDQGPSFQRLMAEFDDLAVKNLLVGVDDLCAARPLMEAERLLQDCLDDYQRRRDRVEQRHELALGRTDDEFALQAIKRLQEERNPEERKLLERKRK
ncbi:MAG: toprim domain-containing protein [Pirellulales bacterium]